jgi:hypothetical protein
MSKNCSRQHDDITRNRTDRVEGIVPQQHFEKLTPDINSEMRQNGRMSHSFHLFTCDTLTEMCRVHSMTI